MGHLKKIRSKLEQSYKYPMTKLFFHTCEMLKKIVK